MEKRPACHVKRQTRETDVRLTLGGAAAELALPVPIFRHLLGAAVATWGLPLDLSATGDIDVDPHHLIEDVGIVLGQALASYLPGYRGVERYGFALVPMDDALAEVALDLSGRPGAYLANMPAGAVGGVDGEVFAEFFHGFSRGALCTLHIALRAGANRHHAWEASFKAFGLALRQATLPRPGLMLSTKGVIT